MMRMTASWPKEKREFIRQLLTFAHDYIDEPEPPVAKRGLRRNKVSTMVERPVETRTITPESLARKRSAISKAQTRHPKHPFVRAAQERFGSVSAWVSRHPRLKLSTVSSWYNTSSNPRPIPPEFAKLIEEELGVPATETVWRNGIR